eukprot:399677-Amphidinium_carterae.1
MGPMLRAMNPHCGWGSDMDLKRLASGRSYKYSVRSGVLWFTGYFSALETREPTTGSYELDMSKACSIVTSHTQLRRIVCAWQFGDEKMP